MAIVSLSVGQPRVSLYSRSVWIGILIVRIELSRLDTLSLVPVHHAPRPRLSIPVLLLCYLCEGLRIWHACATRARRAIVLRPMEVGPVLEILRWAASRSRTIILLLAESQGSPPSSVAGSSGLGRRVVTLLLKVGHVTTIVLRVDSHLTCGSKLGCRWAHE